MNLNLFFELSRDLFCIRGTDGYFEPLSSAWENVLGWTRAELRSQPWIEFVHPDDIQVSSQNRCWDSLVEFSFQFYSEVLTIVSFFKKYFIGHLGNHNLKFSPPAPPAIT